MPTNHNGLCLLVPCTVAQALNCLISNAAIFARRGSECSSSCNKRKGQLLQESCVTDRVRTLFTPTFDFKLAALIGHHFSVDWWIAYFLSRFACREQPWVTAVACKQVRGKAFVLFAVQSWR